MKIKNIIKTAFIKNLTKAYTEGVYADTPQNRKLGRVGMSYKEYAEMKEGEVKDLNKLSWKNSPYDSNIEEVKVDEYKKIQRYKDGDLEVYSIHDENNDLYEVTENEVLDFYNGKKSISQIRKDKKIEEENKENERRQIEVDKIYNLLENSKVLNEAKQVTLDAIIDYSNSANEEGVEGIQISKDASNKDKKLAIVKFYREAAEDDVEDFDSILEDALTDYTSKKENIDNEKVSLSYFKDKRKKDMVKKALNKAKSSNKSLIVGINDDGEGYFIDDAIDYFPGLNKHRVIATCFPNGDIRRGFVELEEEI